MIRLTKLPVPDVLVKNAARWRAELLAALKAGEQLSVARRTRYNNPEIKAALLNETADKCAYCEAKLTHIAYGDIEHITPKSVAPGLSYEWENLTIACDVCNTNKRDKEDLVDPYNEDPEIEHFRFLGPMVALIRDSEVGKLTVTALDLNRTALLERRKERLEHLQRRLGEILRTKHASTKRTLLRALIEGETASEKEFSAAARSFVRDRRADGELPNDL